MDTNFHGYPFNLTPLTEEDGGGWLIVFPDFPGAVMSDGETPEEALANGRDALESVIAAYKEDDRELPAPSSGGAASGKFNLRAPKSLHAKLARQAEIEGVSMNTLAVTLLAEGLGRKQAGYERSTINAEAMRAYLSGLVSQQSILSNQIATQSLDTQMIFASVGLEALVKELEATYEGFINGLKGSEGYFQKIERELNILHENIFHAKHIAEDVICKHPLDGSD